MDDWERSFVIKSERRRARARRRQILRRIAVVALLSIAILTGLWLVDNASSFLFSPGSGGGASARHH